MPKTLSESDVAALRERILLAAEGRLKFDGLESLTMRRLADDLGISPMTSYRYFKDKEAIVAALRTRAFNRFAETMEAAGRGVILPIERARAVAQAYIGFASAQPEIYRLMFDYTPEKLGLYPELDQAMARAEATQSAHIKPLVTLRLLKGDPDVIGKLFWAALHGLTSLYLVGLIENEDVLQALWQAMENALVHGLRPRLF